MRNALFILLVFSFTKVFSHEDSFYKYKYDNVTVIIKTGYFNEEINNAKIIGQYASLLCEESQHKEQVFLFFNHDYYPDDENNNPIFMSYQKNYIYEILGFSHDNKRDYDSILLNNEDKIVIQQFGFHYQIKETLELLKFGIENTNILKNDLERTFDFGYNIKSIEKKIIDSVRNENSRIVNKILENKVSIKPQDGPPVDKYFNVSYYSQYGKYILITNEETVIDTLNQVLLLDYINESPQYIVVLESKEKLIVYSYNFAFDFKYKKSKDFNPQIANINKGTTGIRLTLLKWDVLLIEFADLYGANNDMKLIYLLEEDLLITNLMEFINESRTKK